MHIPFGYDRHGREIEAELEALYTAIEYVLDEQMSLREAADWISGHTGRDISHSGFNQIMKKEVAKLTEQMEEENGIREEQDTASA